MATIVTRAGKGSPLTHDEVDANFTNLNTDIGSVEGTDVISTGEAGGNKFLREDGDGTSSWQSPAGGGDLLADGTVPLTSNWDVGAFTITGTQFTSDIATGTAPLVVSSTTEVANLKAATVGDDCGSCAEYSHYRRRTTQHNLSRHAHCSNC